MPASTPNMKLSLPYESEALDVSVLNANFTKIDSFPYIVESGETTAYMSNGNAEIAQYKKITWYYKKYSDGTLEAHTVAPVTGIPCNMARGNLFVSKYLRFYYPSLGQKIIFNRNCFASNADSDSSCVWVQDVSQPGDGSDNVSYESVRLMSATKETTSADKNFYLSFKGTWK